MQNRQNDPVQLLTEGVFEALPVPATLIDAQGVIVDLNSAFIKYALSLGVELHKEERVGHLLHEFALEEKEREEIQGLVKALLETGEEQYQRRAYEGVDQVSYRDVRAVPIKDVSGRVVGGMILREDVSSVVHGKRESARQKQLIAAVDRIGRQVLSTLDQEHIVNVLVEEVLRLDLFRSMVIELVDMDRGTYQMVRAYLVPGIKYLKDMEAEDRAEPYEAKEKTRGVHLSLEQDALRRDIVAQKKMLVIEGWDERFDRNFINPERQADKAAFFVPVLREGEVLAILSTGCEREDKEQVLANLAALQPLLSQVALALYLARLHQASQERNQLQLAEQAVRLKIAAMQKSEDLVVVTAEISAQLRVLGVEHDSCSIQIINAEGKGFISISPQQVDRWPERYARLQSGAYDHHDFDYPWVRKVWRWKHS